MALSLPVKSQTYFPALTGVRAIAAYLVVFYHLNPFAGPRSLVGVAVQQTLAQGWVGVSVFFVLSGFLITNRYASNLTLSTAWLRRYLQNRFARIYPIFFLLSTLSFALLQYAPLSTSQVWKQYQPLDKLAVLFLNFTLLRAFFKDLYLAGLPTAWSLTVEETFYLLIPFLLLAVARKGKWLLLLYPPLLIGVGLALVFLGKGVPFGFFATVRYLFVYTFFGRCLEFLIGVALALQLPRLPRLGAGGWLTGLALANCMLCVAVLAAIGRYLPNLEQSWRSFGLVFGVGMIALPCAVAAFFAGLIQEDTWLRRLLATPALELLGKSSYALYLLHLGPLDDLFSQYISANCWVRISAYTVVAILLYKYVEHPLHARLRAQPKPVALL